MMKRGVPMKAGASIVLGILAALALVIVFSLAWPRVARAGAVLTIQGVEIVLLSRDELVNELRSAWQSGFEAGKKTSVEPAQPRLQRGGPTT